jgi:hypothetical protein
VHASDVVQTVNFFLKTGPAAHLSDTETFGIILAAIIHDFDHPGLNNAFMINSRSEIAIRYNDVSVLENYHIARCAVFVCVVVVVDLKGFVLYSVRIKFC